ncbi:RNA polymerase sigma factor [Dermatobacter hominis]|uniref:RNA polymerase sigma factor n=1 Tax=Dermatobacter hominis TaxID=2884263 RepID=UPI001D0FF435|nr:sigma-70 family RNA polymerase sigma factor [Dermatobacter hominis]UDY36315.1 sigma-70 family RNA polymerase sigma factor [Dermatobacter hominis]
MDRTSRRRSSVDLLDDAALLTAVGLGDETAAVAFVGRFQAQVFGLAVRMCGDGRLAEDIAQSTFERAWRHAGSYDPRLGSVRTWLLTICRRLAIDALRVRRPSQYDPQALQPLLPPSSEADPTDAAVADDELGRVRRGLTVLPEPQRRALLLATLGGHTAAEVAAIEGIPLGTAKTRLRNGLRRLRDVLRDDDRADVGPVEDGRDG